MPSEVEQLANAKVLLQVAELYDTGIAAGAPGSGLGLAGMAAAVGCPGIRKPRRKISVMLIGNHSAGKSSFINWYIGEQVCRTGVAIETRGFIFVTSGRKRETLTGDATLRYFDHVAPIGAFDGVLPNLFTEISTSKDRSFAVCDFIDTPGLVDGDMKYPFDVKEAICWMADHVDLILTFFDPIGQATCKRTMEVVEQLNAGPDVEKVHYFMSKADEVERESDRQRVLIQITQNLATRIRNSHAFNLPTFYLPHTDGLPCPIPNAIEDVCEEIDRAINLTVQKNLRRLRGDCGAVHAAIAARLAEDAANKRLNGRRTGQGLLLLMAALAAFAALAAAAGMWGASSYCLADGGGYTSELSDAALCRSPSMREALRLGPVVGDHATWLLGGLSALAAAMFVAFSLVWRAAPSLTKKELRRLEEYRAVVKHLAAQEQRLYDEYFSTIAHDNAER